MLSVRHMCKIRSIFEQRVSNLMASHKPKIVSYAKLSRKSSIAPAVLQAMFRLEMHPSVERCQRLAECLGVTIDELVRGTENDPRSLQTKAISIIKLLE